MTLFLISITFLETNGNLYERKCTGKMDILYCSDLDHFSEKQVKASVTNETHSLIFRNVKNLVLKRNQHTHKIYKNLKGYRILNITNLHIEPGAFEDLENVYVFKMYKSKFPEIKNETFRGLNALKTLEMELNQIEVLNSRSFAYLFKLEKLTLTDNMIRKLPAFVFSDLKELESLYINNNQIEEIDENAFEGLTHLYVLSLTRNFIHTINTTEFSKIKKLQHLHLEYNKIKSLSGQLNLPELKFLQLNDNELTNLNKNVFRNCEKLESVDLSSNMLGNLNEQPFLSLQQLKLLNIGSNSVNRTDFMNLAMRALIIRN